MCLAIPSGSKCSNSLFSRIWRPISSTPLRLFWFAAFFHLAAGYCIIFYAHLTHLQVNNDLLLTGFVYGILPLLIYGFLFTWMPENYSLLPMHYARYLGIYLIMMTSLLIFEVSIVYRLQWTEAGMLLLFSGWVIALQGLRNIHISMTGNARTYSRILLSLLYLYGASLVPVITRVMFDIKLLKIMPYLPMLVILSLTLIVTAVFVLKTPGRRYIMRKHVKAA